MRIIVPNLRELIREYAGGPIAGLSRPEFRRLARKAMDERDAVQAEVDAGAFDCDYCNRRHYGWAPPGCRQAHAAGI